MKDKVKTKKEVIRVEGRLKEVVTVHDGKGRMLHKIISPLMVEFHPKDALQVLVGATILAIPVGYTEETWRLGEQLPLFHTLMFLFLSILFISLFVYYNYYRHRFRRHRGEFTKRVIVTYLFSFVIVAIILSLIQRAPWTTDWLLSFKRTVIVAFPASLSAAVVDAIK